MTEPNIEPVIKIEPVDPMDLQVDSTPVTKIQVLVEAIKQNKRKLAEANECSRKFAAKKCGRPLIVKCFKNSTQPANPKIVPTASVFEDPSYRFQLSKDIDMLTNILKVEYSAEVHLHIKENCRLPGVKYPTPRSASQHIKGLFFQTIEMKCSMDWYPEFLCIDKTYKLLGKRTPVYLFIVDDSLGKTRLAGVGILFVETIESFTWMVYKFKRRNATSKDVKCIMGDWSMEERSILKTIFPGVATLITKFHMLVRLRYEMRTEKFGITLDQKQLTLDLLEKLIYSSNHAEFDNFLEALQKHCSASVMEYLNENWLNNVEEWWLGNSINIVSLLSQAHNRLGCYSSRLIPQIPKCATLVQFIDKFVHACNVLRTFEGEDTVLATYHKFNSCQQDGTVTHYMSLLTAYAAKLVGKQMEMKPDDITVTRLEGVNDKYIVFCSEGRYDTTIDECNCQFRETLMLPCRHIFAVREVTEQPKFDPLLCHQRWTMDYLLKHRFISFRKRPLDSPPLADVKDVVCGSNLFNTFDQKLQIFTTTMSAFKSIVCGCSDFEFEKRMDLLNRLTESWKECREVQLNYVPPQMTLESIVDVDEQSMALKYIIPGPAGEMDHAHHSYS